MARRCVGCDGDRIINEVRGVIRVVYDIRSQPPAQAFAVLLPIGTVGVMGMRGVTIRWWPFAPWRARIP
jgi:GMP synthase PP-ATPase subunit